MAQSVNCLNSFVVVLTNPISQLFQRLTNIFFGDHKNTIKLIIFLFFLSGRRDNWLFRFSINFDHTYVLNIKDACKSAKHYFGFVVES